MQKLFNISKATAKSDITLLKSKGLIEYIGARKAGRYILTKKGENVKSERVKVRSHKPDVVCGQPATKLI